MKTVEDILNEFKQEHPDYDVVFLTQYGSHLYGFNNENSDTDIKGVYLPSVSDLVTQTAPEHWTRSTGGKDSKNTKDDIDVELFSLHKYLDMLSKGITVALDIHFASSNKQCTLHTCDIWRYVELNGTRLISKNLRSLFGYCVGQSHKYGLKGARLNELKGFISWLENLNYDGEVKLKYFKDVINTHFEEAKYEYIKVRLMEDIVYVYVLGKNYLLDITLTQLIDFCKGIEARYGKRAEASVDGVDLKALSHSFRILDESEELLTTGKITFPVKNTQYIKDLRNGLVDTDEAFTLLHEKLDMLMELEKTDKNVLPEVVDLSLKQEMIISIYEHVGM
jgi:hypothetical protein